jgi:hypothetical protein
MGKVILEFDSITEQEEYQTAIDGYKWKISIWDFDQKLRGTTKYGKSIIEDDKIACELESKIAEKYRELIREILNEHNLTL